VSCGKKVILGITPLLKFVRLCDGYSVRAALHALVC
jgi:hypothetical protein